MKVFLTGASGILGTDIFSELQKDNNEVLGFDSKQIDITNLDEVRKKITDFKPDMIIHAAAMTNVDLCEEDKEAALLANAVGPQNMALCANEIDAPLVYISSCGVYGNGNKMPHRETDETLPVNYHHFTKLEGENRVKEHTSKYFIVRPGWLFGGTTSHKKNFVEARRKEALVNHELKSAADKFGSPTYTLDLAKQIIELMQANVYGTFNAVNTGTASRFDYVSAIIKAFNFSNKIIPVESNAFPRKANMPDNEMLENAHLNLINLNRMRPWKDALKEYIVNTY